MKEHLVQRQKSLLPLLKCLKPPIDGSEIHSAVSLFPPSELRLVPSISMCMFLIVIMIFLGFFCILVLCVDQCEYKKRVTEYFQLIVHDTRDE